MLSNTEVIVSELETERQKSEWLVIVESLILNVWWMLRHRLWIRIQVCPVCIKVVMKASALDAPALALA